VKIVKNSPRKRGGEEHENESNGSTEYYKE
jgi:hypothetical protein